jgi:gluconolactonase
MNVEAQGVPDGMKVDVEGNVYCTGGGGLWVVDSGGRHLGTFVLPEQPANVAFGGPDNQTIYLTARTSLYSIRGSVPGVKVF